MANATEASLAQKVRYCENLYAREQLQTVFRLRRRRPVETVALDGYLEERGYRKADETLVLSRSIDDIPEPASGWRVLGLDEWLELYAGLTEMSDHAQTLHRLIIKSINSDAAFAVVEVNGQLAACGMAVREHNLVGLFDIFTSPKRRKAGHGADMVNGLLHWAAAEGADTAYLQMVTSNTAAAKLYGSLGFEELDRYWYRIST